MTTLVSNKVRYVHSDLELGTVLTRRYRPRIVCNFGDSSRNTGACSKMDFREKTRHFPARTCISQKLPKLQTDRVVKKVNFN